MVRKRRSDRGKKRRRYKRRASSSTVRSAAKGAAVGLVVGAGIIGGVRLGKSRRNMLIGQLNRKTSPATNLLRKTSTSKDLLKQRRASLVKNSGLSVKDFTRLSHRAKGGSKSAQRALRNIGKSTKRIKRGRRTLRR